MGTDSGATPQGPSRRLSRAAQLNVDRALEAQRERNAWPVLTIRVGVTAAGSLLFLTMSGDDPAIVVSRVGTWVYFGLALALAALVYVAPRLRKLSLYGVAVIDIPLLTYLQYAQLATLPVPLMNAPANAAMMTGLVVLSALSLSRIVIACTAGAAMASVAIVAPSAGMLPLPISLLLIVIPGVAFCSIMLVERIRDVVRQSRQRDLLGKYILGERLGAGGMAEVFSATYCPEGGFERRVAVKRILPSFLENAEAVSLFRREAKLGATLAHPNLVNVLDFGSTETEGYFLVMEYVDGCSLAEVLRAVRSQGSALPPVVVAYLAWTLADALDYLHEHLSPSGVPQHLVHRDVNPPNVLISRNGDVKLSDFGIARDVDGGDKLTQDGLMRGKLAYSAPEQLLGLEPDGRLDLFALGVTLHECLARRPFAATDPLALQRLILAGTREPLPPEVAAAAGPLVGVIDGLLATDRDRRTRTARDVLHQLSTLPQGEFDLREGRRQLTALVASAAPLKGTPSASPALEVTAQVAPPTQ